MKKSKINLTFFLVFIVSAITNAQTRQTRLIEEEFVQISVSSGIDLYLTQGDEIKIEVECKSSDQKKIITKAEGNNLIIRTSYRHFWTTNEVPKVYVTFKEIRSLSASGGADVYGLNTIKLSRFRVSSNGGAEVKLELISDNIKLNSSGGSDIRIKGITKSLTATISGGSGINTRELKAQYVDISSSGGSNATVWAEKKVIAYASGGSNIIYYGNPETQDVSESGGGEVNNKQRH